MSRRARAILMVAMISAGRASAQDGDPNGGDAGWKLSGYYKNILSRSETVFPAGERYTLDLNRLRLELQGKPADALAVDVQYDNEILLGSYLHTAQFQIQKDQKPDQYWKAESNYVEAHDYYGISRLYRGTATWSSGETDVRFGRQRIAWGTGRFWSPLDILNPFSPTQLEREERVGTDALLVDRKLGPLSRLSAVYAPAHDRGNASAAGQWHTNVSGIDFSAVTGKFHRDHVTGVDVATQVGSAGARGELTHTRPETGPGYRRVLVGADYAFANTLTLTGELYYNGAGASDTRAYDFASLFAGHVQSLARRYAGIYAGYEITPLLKWNNYLVVNADDRSRFFSPSLVYSIRTNIDLAAGVQLFRGSEGSEYGRLNDVYYAQMQWFF
jgi:hypothetical protein